MCISPRLVDVVGRIYARPVVGTAALNRVMRVHPRTLALSGQCNAHDVMQCTRCMKGMQHVQCMHLTRGQAGMQRMQCVHLDVAVFGAGSRDHVTLETRGELSALHGDGGCWSQGRRK
jgi:hypothetical protein